MENARDYIEIAGLVIAAASAIAALTPTDADNKAVGIVIRLLDVFALNWGKRNPRK